MRHFNRKLIKLNLIFLIVCLGVSQVGMADVARIGLAESDVVRVAEARQLVKKLRSRIWTDWDQAPFAILLISNGYEYLLDHPRPSDDFQSLGEDPVLGIEVMVRPAQFAENLLATFPAVGGVPTIVVGTAEVTGKSSTEWVLTLLHEHFHQLQYSRPDYYPGTQALDLAGDDTSGMWMLNYPFAYQDKDLKPLFQAYSQALKTRLEDMDNEQALADLKQARQAVVTHLREKDQRYMDFQIWQEGVARYTEYKVAEAASQGYQPLDSFTQLDDYLSYQETADNMRRKLLKELSEQQLDTWQRVVFYAIGAAEALLLDQHQPDWRDRYFASPFKLILD